MKRSSFLWLLGSLGAGALGSACRDRPNVKREPDASRLVSLGPSITETLFAIGAGPRLVAVSDYCESPEAARKLPRVGTSLTPNYESIARLAPTLVLGEKNAGARRRELEALAPTRLLPWLTLFEICESTTELGRLTSTEAAGNALAQRLLLRLSVPEPRDGPRVLLVLGDSDSTHELWFIRKNSLHGAALHACGARNAVAETVNGPPRLSHERLLALDPDAILILSRPRRSDAPMSRRSLSSLARLTSLRAVREQKLSLIEAEEAFANGPRILTLVDKLKRSLQGLGLLP